MHLHLRLNRDYVQSLDCNKYHYQYYGVLAALGGHTNIRCGSTPEDRLASEQTLNMVTRDRHFNTILALLSCISRIRSTLQAVIKLIYTPQYLYPPQYVCCN